MAGRDPERARAILGTLVLAVLVGVVGWLAVRAGHLGMDAGAVESAASSTPSFSRPSSPTPSRVPSPTHAVPPDPEVEAAFDARTAELGGQYALAWVDADGLHALGSPPGAAAWSTIKVPLAIAAASRQPTDETWQHVDAAITRSDNAAALALWAALGPPEEAATAVDEVLDAYGSPETRTEPDDVRPPFSPFGQTMWSVQSQARFASGVACVPDASVAGGVRAEMGRVVPDQRWGIGALEAAHVKGGWGPEPGGAYVLRQLGDAEAAGERYALALSARSATGGHAQATAEATQIVQWWAQTVAPGAPGLTCTRE